MSEEIIYKGFKIRIEQDQDTESPRSWGSIGKMICFHTRYNLGDKHEYRHEDYIGWDELEEAIEQREDAAVILPIYMYDHSGITINTIRFSCPWDSGKIGFIFISNDALKKEFGVKKLSQKHYADAKTMLVQEVETYDQYLRGDVYGYVIENNQPSEEYEDSCWGMYGYDYCLSEAKAVIDHKVKTLNQNALP